jgi:GntR family transcriptional regulator / MocR family aminotransferase
MGVANTSSMPSLDPTATEPFYRQIYERFRRAISSGVLKPGDRIPSARALTKELGLARGTIDSAYSLLAAEGYIQSRGQAGTIVTPGLETRVPVAIATPQSICGLAADGFRPDSILPFQMGLPALDAFPRKIWARLGARCIRGMQPSAMIHPSVYGLQQLRVEIAAYLQVSRGINCVPSQIFVTSGYRHSVELIAHALLMVGDRVWLENPGYPPTRDVLRHLHIAAVSVPVDQEGMIVSNGTKAAPRARAAVVTPAHQSPLGVSLSLPRRLALLDWASRNNAWIIEDDYDGEYRYVSRPLPALKSLDRDGRVVYSGTFSKVLFPGLRLAYLVVP